MKPGEALNYGLNAAKASNVLWSINLDHKKPDKETPPNPWNSLKFTHDKNAQQTEEWQTHGENLLTKGATDDSRHSCPTPMGELAPITWSSAHISLKCVLRCLTRM